MRQRKSESKAIFSHSRSHNKSVKGDDKHSLLVSPWTRPELQLLRSWPSPLYSVCWESNGKKTRPKEALRYKQHHICLLICSVSFGCFFSFLFWLILYSCCRFFCLFSPSQISGFLKASLESTTTTGRLDYNYVPSLQSSSSFRYWVTGLKFPFPYLFFSISDLSFPNPQASWK